MKRITKTMSVVQVLEMFATEEQAVAWFEGLRWGGRPTCTHCGCSERVSVARSKKHTYWCGACRHHFTVKTGSVMESSRLPLRQWLLAVYYELTSRKGISSLQLSKELGIRQATAWFMLHRLREACRGGGILLFDQVEIDETYLGGKEANKHEHKKRNAGRGPVGKQAVVDSRQREGSTQAVVVERIDEETLQALIRARV